MKELYVLGGYFNGSTNFCFKYDFTHNKWSYSANKMNERSSCAACTVFEGKIVVSGGENNSEVLKSVEAYDYYENNWTHLPSMIQSRYKHLQVSMSNKLFAIGGQVSVSLDVFDSISRKFSSIRNLKLKGFLIYNIKKGACCVGNKIILIGVGYGGAHKSYVYDTDVFWNKYECTTFQCVRYY